MKTILMTLVCVGFLGSAAMAARAAEPEPTAKPDCSEKHKAVEDSNTAVKAAIKPDLTSCADKKGKEKLECEKPLREKAKADTKDAKEKQKEARAALACCMNPKKAGCTQ